MQGLLSFVLSLVCLLVCGTPVWGQSSVDPSDIIPIQKALQAAHPDGNSDLLGQRVTVAGWANSDSHCFHTDRFDVFVQDETGGILLRGGSQTPRVGEGQRMIVAGVLERQSNQVFLSQVELRVLPRQLRVVYPVDLSREGVDIQDHLGELISVEGKVQQVLDAQDGIRVLLDTGGGVEDHVLLFWPQDHRELFDASRFPRDGGIRVVGVLAGKGANIPYSQYYEIWPRGQDDLERRGFSKLVYYRTWLVLLVALLFCVLSAVVMQRQVRAKTAVLRETQERFQTVYEAALDAILIADPTGRIRSANPAAVEISGFSSSELRGKPFTELLAQNKKSLWGELVHEIREKASFFAERKLMRSDQKAVDVDVRASAVELNGKPFFLILLRDISDRKRALLNLLQEKERLAVTLTSVADGVIAVDVKGRILSMNPAAARLCRYDAAQSIGEPLDRVFRLQGEDLSVPPSDPVQEVIRKRATVTLPMDAHILSDSQKRIPISGICAPVLDPQKHIAGVVLAFHDISDRVKRMAEVERAAKLESIGILAGGIAHDFNNIMTSVIGNMSLAESLCNEQQPEELVLCIKEALSSCQRAKGLTSRLLTFSSCGDSVLRTVDLHRVIESACAFSFSGTSLDVEVEIAEDLRPSEVDEIQLIQGLSNILINAKEASPTRGKLMVRARNVDVEPSSDSRIPEDMEPGPYVQITIRDFGPGIRKEDLHRVFDPYFTTKSNGSGLGLSAAYSILKNHRGYIGIQSEEGEGTTVTLYLPASRGRVDPEPDVVLSPRAPASVQRVLVMDHEKAVRRVALMMLNSLGVGAEGADSGEEAVRMVAESRDAGRPFDLLIMDLTVPGGMGGRDAIVELKKIDPAVRAIVSSGYSTDPVMSRYETYGFSAVMAKPYNLQELQRAIQQALSSGSAEDSA